MKIIKLTLIALTFAIGQLHQSIQAMETPKITEQKKYQPKNAEALKKLRAQKGKPVVRNFPSMQKSYLFYTHKKVNAPNINAMRELREQSIDNFVEKKKPKKTVEAKPIAEKYITSQARASQPNNTQELVFQAPMEKEITNSNPHIEIINRSQNVQKDLEHAAITIYEPSLINTNGSTDLPNNQNDAKDELEKTIVNIASLKHIDPETKKEAIGVVAQLMSSNLSTSTPELEDFPRPNGVPGNANNNPNHQSSAVNNIDELQNQLPSNEQIVKTATSLNETLKQQKIQQSTLVQKQLTQEELFEATRKKIDKFEQVLDTTYVKIFDKFITSTQNLPEPKTSGFMEFYYNRFFGANQQQDPFAIAQFADKCERTVESLFIEIKNDLHKIADQNKRNELINYFKQNKNKWCMNSHFTEKSLNALMNDNKHKTSQELENITIKNGDNETQVTPELFKKITKLTDECTNDMPIYGNTIFDKSNLLFEKKYRIEKAKAEKYKLPQLVKTANTIYSTISTWMITQLY